MPAQTGRPTIPSWFHVLLAMFVSAMLLMSWLLPETYSELLEEDRIVEWSTVGLFLPAGLIGLRMAIRRRLIFGGLVSLFCIFVAGEELSWGQRLIGFDSPEFFLANNFQQEMTLHNVPQSFVTPKWFLMIVLAGYGLFLPSAERTRRLGAVLVRVGAAAPPLQLVPWFAAAIVLLLWYPLPMTAEWVEGLSGALFLASTVPPARTLGLSLTLAVLLGFCMTSAVGALETSRDSSRIPCATDQVESLVDDVVLGKAATKALWEAGALHKRVWTGTVEGYLRPDLLRRFRAVTCDGPAAANFDIRQSYVIDPWGSPYWFSITPIDEQERLVVLYSFGTNRRRDDGEALPVEAGGDVLASGVLRRPGATSAEAH